MSSAAGSTARPKTSPRPLPGSDAAATTRSGSFQPHRHPPRPHESPGEPTDPPPPAPSDLPPAVRRLLHEINSQLTSLHGAVDILSEFGGASRQEPWWGMIENAAASLSDLLPRLCEHAHEAIGGIPDHDDPSRPDRTDLRRGCRCVSHEINSLLTVLRGGIELASPPDGVGPAVDVDSEEFAACWRMIRSFNEPKLRPLIRELTEIIER